MSDKSFDAQRDADAGVEQLKAADPARDVQPDVSRLESSVRSRITSQTGAPEAVDEISGHRERPAPTWTRWVAAAAAAVVVVGGGGFALGRSTDVPQEREGVISATDGRADTSADSGPAMSAEGGATLRDGGQATSDMGGGFFGGRTLFSSSGFSAEGGSAEAWTFQPRKTFSAASASALAEKLGIKDKPRLLDGAWMVGSPDGSGPTLRLEPDGITNVNFYDPRKDPSMCMKADEMRKSGGGAQDPGTPADVQPELRTCEARPDRAEAPSGKAAVAKTKDLLRSLGADPNAFEYLEGEGDPDGWMTQITAFGLIDGQRTGITWNVSWVADGLQSANGAIAPLVPLGPYAVVSEKEAVERLADPRFGAGSPYGFFARDTPGGGVLEGGGSVSGSSHALREPARTVPPALEPGSRISWPVENVTLTKARLGVALHVQADGSSLLLPTYELSSRDGRTWSVVAVADKHLDFDSKN